MSVLQAVFLGLVQGLTEFLPVSSSGHLTIFQNIFHIDTGNSVLFDVLLHIGTLLVVFLVYWKDICKLIVEAVHMLGDLIHNLSAFLKKGKEEPSYRHIIRTNYRKFVVLIIVSTIPTAIIGFAGEKLIRDASATLIVPGICLLITGLLLFLSDRVENCWKIPKDVSWGEGILIGVAQGFATLPGLSRSGTTISACTFCASSKATALSEGLILNMCQDLGMTAAKVARINGADLNKKDPIKVVSMMSGGFLMIERIAPPDEGTFKILDSRHVEVATILCIVIGEKGGK